MPNAAETRVDTRQVLVAAIVGVALMFQALFVPLHLAGSHHQGLDAAGAGGLSSRAITRGEDDHHHEWRHSGSDESDAHHESHPVTDHLALLAQATDPLFLVHAGTLFTLQAVAIPAPDLLSLSRGDMSRDCPRPRPPRGTAPSRAPPIAT
jgi:hypothetical protein